MPAFYRKRCNHCTIPPHSIYCVIVLSPLRCERSEQPTYVPAMISPINPNLPHLPGEPRAFASENPGESNAKAKLETIVALYDIELWRSSDEFNPSDWSGLSVEMHDLLSGDNQSEEEACQDSIDDYLWRMCREYHYGIEYSATWSMGSAPDGLPDKFNILISGGGPSCWITGDFGLHGSIDRDSLQVHYSWASQARELLFEPHAWDALQWFCAEACC